MYLFESTPTERAALLTYWLSMGQELTTAEVAENFQVSQRTAQRLFAAVSRTVPIYRDEATGFWRLMDEERPFSISPY